MYKAKKSLGQNFLKSIPALHKIIEAGQVTKDDTVLEIGPGKGALTAKLLEKAGHVIAVEKDDELLELLKIKFAAQIESGSLVLVHDDILEFNLENYAEQVFSQVLGSPSGKPSRAQPDHSKILTPLRYKIIANIPYNITGAILRKFLTADVQPVCMVLMVQHEVAQRIVGRDKESILSISVKAYGEPKMIMKVPARYFSPAPKVDSAVISIQNISRKTFPNSENEKKFWEIVKMGFAHKRKLLSSNLKELFSPEKLASLGLGNKRAEDISLSEWISLIPLISIVKA